MISAPHTYSEWTKVIALLKEKENDEDVLTAMKNGTLEWQAGVAERFIKRIDDAVAFRMNQAVDRFQRNMMHAGQSESVIVQSLIGLRKEMAFLREAVEIQAVPDEYRKQLCKVVADNVDKIQGSLEDSAQKADRSGKLSAIVRNHRINSF